MFNRKIHYFCGKSQFLMGKSTISVAIINSFFYVYVMFDAVLGGLADSQPPRHEWVEWPSPLLWHCHLRNRKSPKYQLSKISLDSRDTKTEYIPSSKST